MPKVDWRPHQEQRRCTHKPLCARWRTQDGRIIRICRMSDQHLSNAIRTLRAAYHARKREANGAWAFVDTRSHTQAAVSVEQIAEELDEEVYLLEHTLVMLKEEEDRRGAIRND